MTYRIVIPISGGKDSQACLQLACAAHARHEILGLFCDTNFEHPKTYAHVEFMRKFYGVKIQSITAGSVLEKVWKYRRFPGGGARHCTDELKIVPSRKFYKELAENQGHGFEVWYGMRLGESTERAKRYRDRIDNELYLPHEVLRKYPKYLGDMGIRFKLPLLEWDNVDVLEFLDGKENPLYRDGFDRVGCFPCLASGDAHKERAFAYDEFGRMQAVSVQFVSIHIGKSVWTSKAGKARNDGGCAVCQI
ncbi:phosphoadenosine phosphosulfate reductase [Burkholderia phage BcepB1A]|uniref:phosphoadenosine phosphosulfate reductase n=1 Tax=Burkholderia phage BcepB1A TaxID=279530 RepID=UPI00003779AD|nr:phosphoadenosine phosphosulfate reductase [Burkholderia phage BcepB1A]AAT37754.1 gp61 [Burkholderia phage BcepB1A]